MMETGKNTSFAASLSSAAVKLRWFTCNCTQLELPDGTTLLVDPYLPLGDEQLHENMNAGFDVDDLKRVDFILINHTHIDHIGTLKRTYERYKPMIICHQSVAMLLSEAMEIPCDQFIPIDNDQCYDFDVFKLETYLGLHVQFSKGMPSGMKRIKQDPKMERLGKYGFTYNTNFIITTPGQLRIGVGPGLYESIRRAHWDRKGIHLLLRQYYPNDRPIARRGTVAEDFADELAFVGAPLAIPIHHEMTYIPNNSYDEMNAFAQEVNALLAKQGSVARLLNPERGKWYDVTVGITLS